MSAMTVKIVHRDRNTRGQVHSGIAGERRIPIHWDGRVATIAVPTDWFPRNRLASLSNQGEIEW